MTRDGATHEHCAECAAGREALRTTIQRQRQASWLRILADAIESPNGSLLSETMEQSLVAELHRRYL